MGEPILPYQSGVLGYGVLGYMTLGEPYTPLGDLTQAYDLGSKIWVEIYTPAFVMAGVVGDYEALRWTDNWYDFNTWELSINSSKVNVSAFESEGLMRFVSDGVEHIDWIEGIKRVLKPRGEETHTVSGRGIEAIFAQRYCIKDTTDRKSGV